jgi:hypothetical protein
MSAERSYRALGRRWYMAQTSVEKIVAEIQELSSQERLRLIRTVVDTLITPGRPAELRRLTFGEFRGGRMSTEDDFRIAEWRPLDREMNGP